MLAAKNPGHPTNRPDAQTLSDLYAVKTAREIAAMYGVTEVTVRSWIAKYRREIERPDSKK